MGARAHASARAHAVRARAVRLRARRAVRWCSVRLDRAAFARQRRRHRGGAPARALCWRCACLRCARLRLPCSRCVYLLCVRLLCTCRPDRQYASPVRAGKPARTGAVRQAEICCFGGFNSRPHRTANLHDLVFWRIRLGRGTTVPLQ